MLHLLEIDSLTHSLTHIGHSLFFRLFNLKWVSFFFFILFYASYANLTSIRSAPTIISTDAMISLGLIERERERDRGRVEGNWINVMSNFYCNLRKLSPCASSKIILQCCLVLWLCCCTHTHTHTVHYFALKPRGETFRGIHEFFIKSLSLRKKNWANCIHRRREGEGESQWREA